MLDPYLEALFTAELNHSNEVATGSDPARTLCLNLPWQGVRSFAFLWIHGTPQFSCPWAQVLCCLPSWVKDIYLPQTSSIPIFID